MGYFLGPLSLFFYYFCPFAFDFAVDPSKQNPFAPKPIYPAQPASLNSSASSTNSSMTASPPAVSPRTSLKIELNVPAQAMTTSLSGDKTDTATTMSGDARNDLNNNHSGSENVKRTDVPVRKIAGKKISALFEV